MPGIFFTVTFVRFVRCSCDMSLHRVARAGRKHASSVAVGRRAISSAVNNRTTQTGFATGDSDATDVVKYPVPPTMYSYRN